MSRLSLCSILLTIFVANTALIAQPEVDSIFGKRTVNAGHAGWAKDMLVQPDDKIVMISSCFHFEDGFYSVCIARLNSDGSLDTTFVGAENRVPGIVRNKLVPGCNCGGDLFGIAQQSSGKLIVTGTMGAGLLGVARYNADGSIDSSFGTGGSVLTDVSPNNDRGRKVVIQPDGKIVVIGYSFAGDEPYATSQLFVVRYTADGVLDSSFATAGIFRANVPGNQTSGQSIAIRSDGKILAGGEISGPDNGYLITRLNSDGTPDTAWDGDGYKIISHATSGIFQDFGIVSLEPRADGRVLALGSLNRIYRLNSDGSLDTSFGFGLGWRFVFPESYNREWPYDMMVTAGGRITVVGHSQPGGLSYQFEVARYFKDGAEDLGFSNDGYLTIDITSGNDGARVVASDSQGRIVVAGINALQGCSLCNPWVPSSFAVTRLVAPAVSIGISGRVLRPNGTPIMNAILTTQDNTGATRIARTNPFGYYRFIALPANQNYTISVRAKGRTFDDRAVFAGDDVVNFDFASEEP